MTGGDIFINGVRRTYVARGREVLALDGIDLHIAAGEFVALVGPSGCGKSTLMNMIAGILPTVEGEIRHDGRPVTGINRAVGYMTQQDAVLPWRTVAQNVALPLRFHGVPAAERADRVAAMLDSVGLTGFGHAYPAELSGGMRKRVALAQTFINRPDILLLDEPFSALDVQTRALMQDELLHLCSTTHASVVFVTHDLEEAVALADEVYVLTVGPATVKSVYPIDLPRPRDAAEIRYEQQFVEISRKIWQDLREEVKIGNARSEIPRDRLRG